MLEMASLDENFDCTLRQACSVLSMNGCKDSQRMCSQHLLSNRDVLACLPTGYRKSFIHQAWPIVCSELAKQGVGVKMLWFW